MRFPAADHVLNHIRRGTREEPGDRAFLKAKSRFLKLQILAPTPLGNHCHFSSRRLTQQVTKGNQLENGICPSMGKGGREVGCVGQP